MNNKSKRPGALILLTFSTLTQAGGQPQMPHSHYELRSPLLLSTWGSSQIGRLNSDGAVVMQRFPLCNPRQSGRRWQPTEDAERIKRGAKGQGTGEPSKRRQRPLSGRRIDSGSLTSDTAETNVEPTPDGQITHTLTYHWRQYAGTSLCSKVPFQLSVLPADTEPGLIVEDAQLGEHGCFCVAISPTTAKGQAALYFNADEGQFDTHLSTLEVNGKPVPLDQLEPLGGEVPVQGHGLELSAALIEGLEGVPEQTPIRLDASQVKVRQYGGGQSRQRDSGNNHPDSTPPAASGRSSQSVTPPRGQGTSGAGHGDDEDRDPDQQDSMDQSDPDQTDRALALLVTSLIRLLQTTEPTTLDILANDLERHLAVQGTYGDNISTLNVRLNRAISQLGLVIAGWREVLAYLQAHPDQVNGFVQALGERNRTILQAAINRLSGQEVVVTRRARKESRTKAAFKRRSISFPDLQVVNVLPEQPSSTLTSILSPLLCQMLPERSRWQRDASTQRVLDCLGKAFEALPPEWRFSFWQRLMQALGLPEGLDFSHYRTGLVQRIHQFMGSRRGSRQRLARALAETLPAGTVSNMILELASCQQETECGQSLLTAQEFICPVNEAEEASLEDLLKKLRAAISDDELLNLLVKFLQTGRCPLDEANLNTVFCQHLGTPFGSGRWRQALLHLCDSQTSTRLSEFVLALNGTNRACLAWGVSTLNHVSGRLSEVMRAQAAERAGVEISGNPPTGNNRSRSVSRPSRTIPVSLTRQNEASDEYVPMMPKSRDSATGQR